MTKTAFDSIMGGLGDALAYAQGDKSKGRRQKIRLRDIDVARARRKLKLSQVRFAEVFGISVATVRNWEQGIRHPSGPARTLLHVIDREPEAVLRSLHGK